MSLLRTTFIDSLGSAIHFVALVPMIVFFAKPLAAVDQLLPKLPEDPSAAFAWFDTLEYPDVSKAQFVEIFLNAPEPPAGESPKSQGLYGFLLREDDESYDVFVINWVHTSNFYKWVRGGGPAFHIGYEPRDFAEHVERRIAHEGTLEHQKSELDAPRFIPPRTESFVIAWAASRRGRHQEAAKLFDIVGRMPPLAPRNEQNTLTRRRIAMDIAHAAMWWAHYTFRDFNDSRSDLFKKFQWLATKFPESEHHERAVSMAAMLARMVREDEAHMPAPLEEMTRTEEIAEWIFRLRDQHGWPPTEGGECDIFHRGYYDFENMPSYRLAALGYVAVPQLIDALGDERFSRVVEYRRDDEFSHRVRTVGWCAEQILAKIAGRRFELPSAASAPRSPAAEVAAKQALVREWYEEVRRRKKNAGIAEPSIPPERNPRSPTIVQPN